MKTQIMNLYPSLYQNLHLAEAVGVEGEDVDVDGLTRNDL